MTAGELDQLLRDRFNLTRADLVTALKMIPAQRPWGATLTAEEAQLFDGVGFVENPGAYAEVAADVIAHTARLISTAHTANDVASGLGVKASRVRQRRLARTLWAIDDDGAWVYPVLQFDQVIGGDGNPTLKQIRGLDRVLPALPTDMHPVAVAGLLLTPQPELTIDGKPRTVLDWLRSGGAVEPVLRLSDVADWAAS